MLEALGAGRNHLLSNNPDLGVRHGHPPSLVTGSPQVGQSTVSLGWPVSVRPRVPQKSQTHRSRSMPAPSTAAPTTRLGWRRGALHP
ncbi:hypothetical protein GCM10009812_08870 [Nocardioides marinus]